MKRTELLLIFLLLNFANTFGQQIDPIIYKRLSENKYSSIFQTLNSGKFSGMTNGYIHLVNKKDTLLLDFQSSGTELSINKIENYVYDDNTKVYTTQTTSGKTFFQYETCMLANLFTIFLNGVHYSIGNFDGAYDIPISGLTFNYCHEKDTEYLTLFVTKPLQLTTSAYLFNRGNISYKEASKNEKAIKVLPGSTLILMVHK